MAKKPFTGYAPFALKIPFPTDAQKFGDNYDRIFRKEKYLEANPWLVDRIARVCHEVNRAYCFSLGDTSQPAWEDAPDWQKDSARIGVKKHLTDEIKTPEESHASWLEQKVKDGWVFGEVKDAEKKTHPCMVPYAELPLSQRTKDFLFTGVIQGMKDF